METIENVKKLKFDRYLTERPGTALLPCIRRSRGKLAKPLKP